MMISCGIKWSRSVRCSHTHPVCHRLRSPDRLAASWLGLAGECSQKTELALLPLTWAFSWPPAASTGGQRPNTWAASLSVKCSLSLLSVQKLPTVFWVVGESLVTLVPSERRSQNLCSGELWVEAEGKGRERGRENE